MGTTVPPASLIDAFFRFFSAGEFDDSAVTPTVHEITGRPSRTFDHWARAHANLFGEPPAPAAAYLALMDDRYRRRDDYQSVRLDYSYPDARLDLNRWLPLVRWLLAIPHYIALAFLEIAAVVVVIVTWFAILFTGRYPRGMFGFVEGVIRWHNRVVAYAVVLATDRYPPFRLAP